MRRARAGVVTGSVLVVALGAFLGLLPAGGVSVADGTCGNGFLPSAEPNCLAAAGWLPYGAWGLTVLGAAVIAGAVAVTFAGVRVRVGVSDAGGRRSAAGAVRGVTDTGARVARRYNGVIIAVASVAVVAGTFLGLLPIAAAPGTSGPASGQACRYEAWCVPGGPAERPAERPAGDDPRPLTPTSWGDQGDWRVSASSALTSLGVLGLFAAVAPPVLAGVARGSLRRRSWTRGTTVVALTALAGLAVGGGLLLSVREGFALRTHAQHSAVASRCAEHRPPRARPPAVPGTPMPEFPGTHPGFPDPIPLPRNAPLPDPPLRPDPPFPGDPRVPDPSAPPDPTAHCERVEQVPNYPAWALVALGALALAAAQGTAALGSRAARSPAG